MTRERKDEPGLMTSFGTGGLPFELARSQTRWTGRRSVFVGLLGAAGVWLGIAYAASGLVVGSALVFLVGAVWTAGSLRSYRRARRLERRSRRTPDW
jgi:Flp pilus assembly protein TadB